jgi:DNA-binding MarR family transcriptional regulator
MVKRTIGCTATGIRCGEDHPGAKLTNKEVDTIRELHESGEYGYRKLAGMFEVSRSSIRYIVKYERRAVLPEKWRTIEED